MTEEQREAERIRIQRETQTLEQRRERDRNQAQDAVTFLIDHLGAEFTAFRIMVENTTSHDLRDAVLQVDV